MHFTNIQDGIDAIVIDSFFTDSQLEDIRKELAWLTKPSIMQDQSSLSSAEKDGVIQTSKRGIFLEEVFRNWQHSALISNLISNMAEKEFQDKIFEINPLYKILYGCNYRTHLLSYYENSDYYNDHTDAAVFTILCYFTEEPKNFSGGEIVLKSNVDNKVATVDVQDNRVVIIASCTRHAVNKLVSDMNNTLSGKGRYCCSAFLSVKDEREFK